LAKFYLFIKPTFQLSQISLVSHKLQVFSTFSEGIPRFWSNDYLLLKVSSFSIYFYGFIADCQCQWSCFYCFIFVNQTIGQVFFCWQTVRCENLDVSWSRREVLSRGHWKFNLSARVVRQNRTISERLYSFNKIYPNRIDLSFSLCLWRNIISSITLSNR